AAGEGARGGTTPAAPDRPLVVVPVAGPAAESLAGRYADVARLTAPDLAAAAAARSRVRAAAVAAGRAPDAVRVLLDVDVALADDRDAALARLDLVRSVDQPDLGVAGAVVAGTGADLATVLADAVRDGAVDGFVVRPTSAEADLAALVERTVPALQQAGAFRLRPGGGGTGRPGVDLLVRHARHQSGGAHQRGHPRRGDGRVQPAGHVPPPGVQQQPLAEHDQVQQATVGAVHQAGQALAVEGTGGDGTQRPVGARAGAGGGEVDAEQRAAVGGGRHGHDGSVRGRRRARRGAPPSPNGAVMPVPS
ncbi:LLM class flavin-dependent oxidoreductase, partial [Cellulomonas sp. ACRRI]|uniref:LLM class flavin-dependent oxidoreductase n=1 Tax=Cellulomonas sp. ACRRI TaxID=2918188 RepID=UPI001EF34494